MTDIVDEMPATAETFAVQFINYYYGEDEPLIINFKADTPNDVDHLVSALSAYYSGDPCVCLINGEKAVLNEDWGLA